MLNNGQELNGTYRIVEQIGSGGGGIVYKAYHYRMRKNVAIKLIKESVKSDLHNRFEVDVLKNLKNDYLPQVLDFVEDGEDVYTVMEYVEGQNFKQLIESGRSFSEKQVRKYALQLCKAVEYLHGHVPPIIHSDIKPSNIMLTPEDKICLIDFNISTMSDTGIGYSKGGSREFGAPEQFKRVISAPIFVDEFREETRFVDDDETEILIDEEKSRSNISLAKATSKESRAFIDVRTDIFGMGASIYYMLTSRTPAGGHTDFRGIHCSPKIKEIIIKCMNPSPSKRYKNVTEIENALNSGKGISPTISAAVAAVIVLAGAGVFLNYNSDKINMISEKPIETVNKKSDDLPSLDELTVVTHTEKTTLQEEEDTDYTSLDPAQTDTIREKQNEVLSESEITDFEEPFDTDDKIVVPSVINKSVSDAIKIIRDAKLRLKVVEESDNRVEKGYVFKQSIASKTEVPEGTEIIIYVSSYSSAAVPSLIGKTEANAIAALEKAGLKYEIKRENDNRVNKGEVFKQSIKSGTEVEKNTIITVYVSTYEKPAAVNETTSSQMWSENKVNMGNMYVTEKCYLRDKPQIGSTPCSQCEVGSVVKVVALTDSGYYKTASGEFIHSDFVSDKYGMTKYFSNGRKSSEITNEYSNGEYDLVWYWKNGLERYIERHDSNGKIINLKVLSLEDRKTLYNDKPVITSDGYSYTRPYDGKYSYLRCYISKSDRDVTIQEYLDENGNVKVSHKYYTGLTSDGYLYIQWYNENNEKTAYKEYYSDGSERITINQSASTTASTQTTVSSKKEYVSDLLVSNKVSSMKVGDTVYLDWTVMPKTSSQEVLFSSSNSSVVSVSSSGKLKALKIGTATITLTSKADKNISREFKIVVSESNVEVIDIKINNVVVELDRTIVLKPIFTPVNTTEKNVEWSVDDTSVAKIDKDGTLTALSKGRTEATVSSKDRSGIRFSFTITVN